LRSRATPIGAGAMIGLQQIQPLVCLVRTQTQAPEQVAIFLRVMQMLGEQIAALQKRAINKRRSTG